jgi:hypothetical protein
MVASERVAIPIHNSATGDQYTSSRRPLIAFFIVLQECKNDGRGHEGWGKIESSKSAAELSYRIAR